MVRGERLKADYLCLVSLLVNGLFIVGFSSDEGSRRLLAKKRVKASRLNIPISVGLGLSCCIGLGWWSRLLALVKGKG